MSLSHRRRIPLAARYNEASDVSLTAGQADRKKNLICALPKDTLRRILELATSTPDPLHPQTRGESRTISKHSTLDSLRLVCRRWNKVILDSPWLYGAIVVSGNKHDMRFVKSGGAPLFIYPKIPQEANSRPVMYCQNSEGTASHQKHVVPVLKKLDRIRFLCLSLGRSDYNKSWIIKALSSTRAPNIRALHLRLTTRANMKGTTDESVDDSTSNATKERIDVSTGALLPSTLFRGDGRELKELVLRGVGVRWNDLTNFGNLTTLALHNQNRINDFDELAELFHSLSGLETLALYRCLPTGQKEDWPGAMCLPCLKNLKLTDDLASIDTFMRRVLFRVERLEIDCDVQDVSETLAFGGVYQGRLESSLSVNAKRLDIMLDLKKPSHICFCTDATASTPFQCFEMRYTVSPLKATPPNALQGLLMTSLQVPNIVILNINVSTNERPHVDFWPRIYELYPAIHTIRTKNAAFSSLQGELKKPQNTPLFRALRTVQYSRRLKIDPTDVANTMMLDERRASGFPLTLVQI